MIRYLFPLTVFIGITVLFIYGLQNDPRYVPSPLINKIAPKFNLPSLHNPESNISVDDIKGTVSLINVWASWCVACRLEHPILNEAVKKYHLSLYGLNYKDIRTNALIWLENLGNPYIESAYDEYGNVGIDYGVYGVPETFLLDKKGVIRYKHIGPIDKRQFDDIIMPLIKELEQHAVQVRPANHAPDGLIVLDGNPLHTSLAQSGKFFFQSETSQLISRLADVHAEQQVLDTCAAPGGKTTALAADMNNTGFLVATDIRKARLALLANTISHSGATNIRLAQADFVAGAPFLNSFDCVVVDAPCTGLGTIRTDPDIRWRCQPSDFPKTTEIQLAILEQASQAVKNGGRLLYSTCSSEPEENEEVVLSFLKMHPKFSILDAKSLRDSLGVTLTSAINSSGHFRTYPFLHDLDAFFATVLIAG